ncbi:MAG: hypothetical protein K2G40_07760 [Muribaculaceae bacterium]|nr:hypothetical protein [Muribaculaceae bacterium]
MKYTYTCFLLLLCWVFSSCQSNDERVSFNAGGNKSEIKALSDSLHRILEHKDLYVYEKEQRISRIKNSINDDIVTRNEETPATASERMYNMNRQLYDEYKKFNADSALYFAVENQKIACSLDRKDWILESQLQQCMIYSMCGSYREAEAILQGISVSDIPVEMLANYYEAYSLFWNYYSLFARYPRQQNYNYGDSLFAHLDPESFSYKVRLAFTHVNDHDSLKSESIFWEMLSTTEPGTPEYAMLTNSYASMYAHFNNWDNMKKYLLLSSITDIRNATRENISLQTLAWFLYQDGEYDEAYRYTQSTIEDIQASGINFRSSEIFRLYSIISSAYHEEKERARANLVIALCAVVIGCVLLILALVYIYRQMKRIQNVRQALSQSNEKLLELNSQLNEKNDETVRMNLQLSRTNKLLHENNTIKEYYITQFFDVCFNYIDKMEHNQNVLLKLAMNKSYAELVKKLKSQSIIEDERDELYARFDKVFLSLYPTFVKDFNRLLRDEEWIVLKPDALLNRELRIYALLRLGISDVKKIANFLCCSVSTVYNYRTRMRNKAALDKDNFEIEIMKIGIISS